MSYNITLESGSSICLPTAGKYCDRDIIITATGGTDSDNAVHDILTRSLITYTNENIEALGSYAFALCDKMESLRLPRCKIIGQHSLNGCKKLTEAYFPVATQVGQYALCNCLIIETLDLPMVTQIDNMGFLNTQKLYTLILRANQVATLSNVNAFNGSAIAKGTGYIYVPATLVDAYKTDTNWSTYADQIRAIEDYPEITKI